MKYTIFYIPGLGDNYDVYRQKALRLWLFFGVNAELLSMNWYADGTYDDRFRHANQVIDKAIASGDHVVLVGESAGASMAINLFAANPAIAKIVTVAGVNAAVTPVAQRTLRRGPAFAESRQRIAESLHMISPDRRQHIYTLSAWLDNVVRSSYSQISGARNYRVWSVGHLFTIAMCLTILAGYIVHLAKRN